MSQLTGRLMRLSMQRFSLAVLFTLSIAILNLSPGRIFADDKSSQPPTRDADTPKEAKTERPPFDLTYVPSDATGVIAIRPNAIFRDPAMKLLAGMMNENPMMEMLLPPYIPSAARKLPLQEIEQIILYMHIIPDRKHSPSSMAGTVMIRAAHDFDWLKLMRRLDPKTKEIHSKDAVFYKSHITNTALEEARGVEVVYLVPDKRTLVIPTLDLRAAQKGKIIRWIGPRPHFSWDKDWKHVEHDLIAFAQVNRQDSGASKNQLGEDPFPEWTALTQKTTTMVAGVDWKDGIDFHAYLTGKDRTASDQILRDAKTLLAELRRDLEQAKDVPEEERQEAALYQMYTNLYKDLAKHARCTRQENTVCVHTTAKINIADVVKCFMFPIKEAVEGKKP